MKKLVKYKFSIVMMLVCFMFLSCAMFQKAKTDPITTAVTAYKLAGETIISSHTLAVSLRANGKITDDQVTTYNEIFVRLKTAYYLAGDTQRLYINTKDAVKKNELMLKFQTLASEAGQLALQINTFLQGVNK